MSLSKLIAPAIALLLYVQSIAQPICGFDQVHGRRMKADRIYRENILRYESNLRSYIQQQGAIQQLKMPKTLSGPPYTIPVVVHVVSTGGAVGTIYNPSDAQIQATINYLNQVYNGTYPGTQGVGDLQIQFVLAKRDPNCNPTNGINRVDGSSIPGYSSGGVNVNTSLGTDEINVKNLIRWDPSQYYNIWVVDKIDGNDGTSGSFVAGFAYFPGGDPNYDGTIMLATQMAVGQKTLPHELGHAFNLYHPFEGANGSTCPANADCTADGDEVCDTDPITQPINFVCRSGTNPCTGSAYSINTESNYMNYTNCSTLFTAGQKTRMLASAASPDRISLSNSLGGTATNAGAMQCLPKINFEFSSDQQTETTASTSGCRSYKDYTYHLLIGNNPTVTATVTLAVNAGTATEGSDFDITTNGNFSSPSKALSFPAGSNASQSFTIRIYDDAEVESTETFTLGFTVQNNGGNAVAGDGRPTFTFTILDNDSAPTAGVSPSGTVNIGTSASSITAAPFDATQQDQRVQILYKASELTAAGVPAGPISGISFNLQTKSSIRAFSGLTISLGKASVNYLINGSVTTGSSMTVVKTISSYNTVSGWNDFNFDSPYTWDGTSNLVVEICYDNGSTSAGDAADKLAAYFDGGTASQGNMFWQSGINCSQAFTSVIYNAFGKKPIIKLVYGVPGTQVQTLVNSSEQEKLGPNADVYFYDQVSHQLMARIQNLSAFDYGCTQVLIDRAGTGATAFWNNTPVNYLMNKTFKVVPTTNNSSGSYAITLYYTQTETNGWQTATGQNISNIELIKATNSISLVTPANPSGAGTVVITTPVVSTLGTNTGLTANFSTGFSGFGAGVAGVALPIRLLSFDGEIKKDHSYLNWSTSTEINSKGFEVEMSSDGINFAEIGFVDGAGMSSTERKYTFMDPNEAKEKNYYRLKQIDLDNQFEYSKVILLHESGSGDGYRILNNPFTQDIGVQFEKAFTGALLVKLLDLTGRQLYTHSFQMNGQSDVDIDLSKAIISKGIYLLELSYNNQSHIERVVKQ